jgi:hypothetical protein
MLCVFALILPLIPLAVLALMGLHYRATGNRKGYKLARRADRRVRKMILFGLIGVAVGTVLGVLVCIMLWLWYFRILFGGVQAD